LVPAPPPPVVCHCHCRRVVGRSAAGPLRLTGGGHRRLRGAARPVSGGSHRRHAPPGGPGLRNHPPSLPPSLCCRPPHRAGRPHSRERNGYLHSGDVVSTTAELPCRRRRRCCCCGASRVVVTGLNPPRAHHACHMAALRGGRRVLGGVAGPSGLPLCGGGGRAVLPGPAQDAGRAARSLHAAQLCGARAS
jgi:hypothetical protein